MKYIESIIKYFFYITTAILIICGVNYSISQVDVLPPDILWNIVLSGFVTAVITTGFMALGEYMSIPFWLNTLLHYLCLCIVMIVFGHRFGWISYNAMGIIIMLVSVAFVYGITFVSAYWMNEKQAKAINKRLKEKYKDKK